MSRSSSESTPRVSSFPLFFAYVDNNLRPEINGRREWVSIRRGWVQNAPSVTRHKKPRLEVEEVRVEKRCSITRGAKSPSAYCQIGSLRHNADENHSAGERASYECLFITLYAGAYEKCLITRIYYESSNDRVLIAFFFFFLFATLWFEKN